MLLNNINNVLSRLLFGSVRGKPDPFEGDVKTGKNSFNNPAYYILEGVPNQSAALASDMLPSSALPPLANKTAPPAGGVGRSKPPSGSSAPGRRQTSGRPVRLISEEGSSEDDGNIGSLNRPPPDFPPPPLPKAALEAEFGKPQKLKIPPPSTVPSLSSPVSGGGGGVAFCMDAPPMLNPSSAPLRRGGGDDQSCSVLQMARTLSEAEYPSETSAPHIRGLTFPPHSIQEESIAEALPEEVPTHQQLGSLAIFTFMHLADAFIQSDLQCIQAIHCFLSVYVFSGNRTHNLCAANAMLYHWATETQKIFDLISIILNINILTYIL